MSMYSTTWYRFEGGQNKGFPAAPTGRSVVRQGYGPLRLGNLYVSVTADAGSQPPPQQTWPGSPVVMIDKSGS